MSPSVALGNSGDAVVAWTQRDGSPGGCGVGNFGCLRVYKAEYRNGRWIRPTSLSDNVSPSGNNALQPIVATDNNGNTILAWILMQWNSDCGALSCEVLQMMEYRGSQWSNLPTKDFSIGVHGVSSSVSLAMNDLGQAFMAWNSRCDLILPDCQLLYPDNRIYLSNYSAGIWHHPAGIAENINPSNRNVPSLAYGQSVVADPYGNALVMWQQPDQSTSCGSSGASCYQIYLSNLRNGKWTHPLGFGDTVSLPGSNATAASAAMDNHGNAIVVWAQQDKSTDCGGAACIRIYTSEFR